MAYSTDIAKLLTDQLAKFVTLNRHQLAGHVALAALVVLEAIRRAGGPQYGYQIAKQLEEAAFPEALPMQQGALYPVLRSLEAGGLLTSRVEPSTAGPPRRYYSMTPQGLSSLREWKQAWRRTRRFVDSIVRPTHVPGRAKLSRTPRNRDQAASGRRPSKRPG